jgi:outer membrane immunogenic protein
MNFKLIGVGMSAIAMLAMSGAVNAADLSPPGYKAPIYTAPGAASWNGFYVGVNAGYGMGKSRVTNDVGSTGDFNVKGALAGGTIGYNFQTGNWVWGVEGDLDMSAIKGSSSTFCVPDCNMSNTWLGTARARIGYAAWGNWLPYLTGGAAFGNIKFDQGVEPDSHTKIGWTAGLGVEYALLTHWSVKAEYLYADLGTATCAMPKCNSGADVLTTFKTNIIRLGVNYRF